MTYSFNLVDVEKKLACNYAVLQGMPVQEIEEKVMADTDSSHYDLVEIEGLHEEYKKDLMHRFVAKSSVLMSIFG
ncbi:MULTISPECIES: hypothetical protein [unclassified Veillonella]|uniref:hypothetical protein n=1 Tax=unclassified Veillonella TaxID=2630086 RepID=UPI00138A5C48|nr:MULTISPECIES: hypothetical protein [unclassified Veillonella]KAF1682292.1 hypothetical protein VER_06080 [Veillonella sp. R32]